MSIKRVAVFGAVSVAVFASLGALLWSQPGLRAATFSRVSPRPIDMLAGSETGGMSHLLKRERNSEGQTIAEVKSIKLRAYYWSDGGQRVSNGEVLTISEGSKGEVCSIADSIDKGDIAIDIKVNDTVKERYTVSIKNVCSRPGEPSNFFKSYDFPDGALMRDDELSHPGRSWYYADVTISYANGVPWGNNNENSVNFRAELKSRTDSSREGDLVLRENSGERDFGLRSAYFNSADKRSAHAEIPFGFPCTKPSGGEYNDRIFLYDADAVFGDTYLWVAEKKQGASGYTKLGNSAPNDGYKDASLLDWDEGRKMYKTKVSNNTYNTVRIKNPNPTSAYKLIVENTGDGGKFTPSWNVVSVKVPYNPYYGSENGGIRNRCNFSLSPYVAITSPTTKSYTYYPNISVTGGVNRSGRDDGNKHAWQVYAVRYSPDRKPSAGERSGLDGRDSGESSACAVVPANYTSCSEISAAPEKVFPDTGSGNFLHSSGNADPLGTATCFIVRVQNPTHETGDDNSWRYSGMDCAIAAKQPKFNVVGGDLRSNGEIRTSVTSVGSKLYSSWGEYGVFSRLCNNLGMRSGGRANDDSPAYGALDPSRHVLTFANLLTLTPVCVGNFNKNLPGVTVDPSEGTSGYSDPSRTSPLTLDSGSFSDIGSGVSRTYYYPEATVYIRNNIEYPDFVGSTAGIPKVRIVAKNIVISNNVGRIDAGLVARDKIVTCGTSTAVDVSSPVISSPSGEISDATLNPLFLRLHGGLCGNQLSINGPVQAGRIYLLRTAGAASDNMGAPAETFRLRPDTYLAGRGGNNPVATTDAVIDLPPRF